MLRLGRLCVTDGRQAPGAGGFVALLFSVTGACVRRRSAQRLRRFEQAEKQMPLKRSFYAEANDLGTDGHPVDDEVERRTENEELKQRIMTAQDQLLGVLDNKRLYLALEELLGARTEARRGRKVEKRARWAWLLR